VNPTSSRILIVSEDKTAFTSSGNFVDPTVTKTFFDELDMKGHDVSARSIDRRGQRIWLYSKLFRLYGGIYMAIQFAMESISVER
jgi:hypothetical protein